MLLLLYLSVKKILKESKITMERLRIARLIPIAILSSSSITLLFHP